VLLELGCWADGLMAAPRVAVCLVALFLLGQQLYHVWISGQELSDYLEAELVHVLPVPLVLSAAACALLPDGLPTILRVFTPTTSSHTWPFTLAFAALTGAALKWYIGGGGKQDFNALLQASTRIERALPSQCSGTHACPAALACSLHPSARSTLQGRLLPLAAAHPVALPFLAVANAWVEGEAGLPCNEHVPPVV
jgi:hypothetical protein